jgi:hypothetical protein
MFAERRTMIKGKKFFQKAFQRRFSLRLHMSLILLATAFSGILGSKLFHALHMENLVIRYPLAVLLSYGVFFLCIRLWLLYVSPAKGTTSGTYNWLNIPSSSGHSSGGGNVPSLRGGGGEFSGAGASASFDSPGAVTSEALASPVPVNAPSDGGVLGGAGKTVAGAADALGDSDSVAAIVAIIVLATLVATILGSAIYVVAQAPFILSDAAFNALFAASLVKRAHVIADEDWVGSILKQTWMPFAVTFVIAFFAAMILHSYFPQASSLSEVLHSL